MGDLYRWAVDQCDSYTAKFPKEDQEYIRRCCESALGAYKCLIDCGHSGVSSSIARSILNDLVNEVPLTPLEDIPDEWVFAGASEEEDSYWHRKRPSLFKHVNRRTKSARFIDTNRVMCQDYGRVLLGEEDAPKCYNGFVSKLVHEIRPIRFPYMPTKAPYIALVEELLTDPKHGDFDSLALRAILTPRGRLVMVDKFFKEDDCSWTRIGLDEWNERAKMDQDRRDREKNIPSYGRM